MYLRMQSDGNNHKRIFFNWLLCLAVLLSIIALYISLTFDKMIQSQAEHIIQADYSEVVELSEDFEEYQQQLQSLAEALVKQQESIKSIEQRIAKLSEVAGNKRAVDPVNFSGVIANKSSHKAVLNTAPSHTMIYTIKSGDTFSKIALTFGVPLQVLIDANHKLNPRSLKVGQQIIIPK